jgi:hypothetical protein
MTTDWKALCELLIDEWDAASGDPDMISFAIAIDRARTALAQPEPVGPTDEELYDLAAEYDGEPTQSMRAALARWGRPALTPIPVSEFLEPEWVRQEDQTHKTTDHAQLIDGEWWAPYSDLFSMQRILDNARAYAAHWGHSAPQPIPVSEYLPGPEDCTTNPRNGQGQWCWGWVQHDPIPFCGRWRMMRRDWLVNEAVYWLPATALPLPRQPAPDA